MIMQIFLPCYYGNELTIASSKLPTALFGSKWVNGNKAMRQNMKVFMEIATHEIEISAFKLFTANLQTFSAIINGAYSLFALLRKING